MFSGLSQVTFNLWIMMNENVNLFLHYFCPEQLFNITYRIVKSSHIVSNFYTQGGTYLCFETAL